VNPVAIEPGRYTTILEPTAVGNLIQFITFAMNARNADEGRSFFSKPGGGNKIGMKVVDERITISSDPLDPEAYANTFSPDGQPISKTTWIENGVVKNLAYDRYWAQKEGKSPVPTSGTVRMSGGAATMDELIASTDRGILLTRFWYLRPVDPRTILYTGLTRDGTFLIERGKITRAIKNFRFNESPIFMLNNLEAMGEPVRVSASEAGGPGLAIVVPPIKVRDFNFTSLSDAV
jgi:predicted Zn-dependent protease